MVTLTADMFSGITDMLTTNVPVLVPVGIAVMSVMFGVSIIPKVLGKFF